jgi:CrcB protein
MIKTLILVGMGGFIGTILRFIISKYVQQSTGTIFPWGTFSVNIIGSLLIGIVLGLSEKGNIISTEATLFLTIGICGGFTTFSSFVNDAFVLIDNKEILKMIFYTSISFTIGLLAVFTGRFLIKTL